MWCSPLYLPPYQGLCWQFLSGLSILIGSLGAQINAKLQKITWGRIGGTKHYPCHAGKFTEKYHKTAYSVYGQWGASLT